MHQNHCGACESAVGGAPPPVSDRVSLDEGPRIGIPNKFQVMFLLMIQALHFENHGPKGTSYMYLSGHTQKMFTIILPTGLANWKPTRRKWRNECISSKAVK